MYRFLALVLCLLSLPAYADQHCTAPETIMEAAKNHGALRFGRNNIHRSGLSRMYVLLLLLYSYGQIVGHEVIADEANEADCNVARSLLLSVDKPDRGFDPKYLICIPGHSPNHG